MVRKIYLCQALFYVDSNKFSFFARYMMAICTTLFFQVCTSVNLSRETRVVGPTVVNLLFVEFTDTFACEERGIFCKKNYLWGVYCILHLVETTLKFMNACTVADTQINLGCVRLTLFRNKNTFRIIPE